MNDSIHGPDVNERHERNKKALAYLDALKHRDEELEREWKEQWQSRGLGCVCVLVFNTMLWYAVYCIAKALGEL